MGYGVCQALNWMIQHVEVCCRQHILLLLKEHSSASDAMTCRACLAVNVELVSLQQLRAALRPRATQVHVRDRGLQACALNNQVCISRTSAACICARTRIL